MKNGLNKISIIIPTFNRAKSLSKTLESFIEQSYSKEFYDIIICDNNSSDDTKGVAGEWIKKSPVSIKYIFEPRQGAHYARNTAAKHTDSEILYFTDDDMIADKDLLKNIVTVFNMNYNIAVAGGKVLPKWEFEPPEWLIKYFKNSALSLIEKSEKLVIASYDIGIYSCHQAILREVLFKCGGFNPDIVKDKLIGDGECGLNIKIMEEGYNFAYVGDSVSYHIIPRSRMTQKYLNLRFANQGNSDSFTTYRRRESNKKLILKTIAFSHFPDMIKRFFGSWFHQISGIDSWRIDRAYVHYYLHRIKTDFKIAINDNWRSDVLKYDWINE